MLQYPTNIYPNNATFDPSVADDNNKISFTFNGDILSGVLYHIYNFDTGELVKVNDYIYPSPTMTRDHEVKAYNGDLFETLPDFLGELDAGGNYGLQMQLVQWSEDGTSPLCDMFVLRGLTQEDYIPPEQHDPDTDILVIKNNIDNIYEWFTGSGNSWRYRTEAYESLAGVMEIVINGERRMFWAYNSATGEIKLNSSFTEPIPAGTPFQIYSNYVVTPLYPFKCRSLPEVDSIIVVTDSSGGGQGSDLNLGFYVTANYEQDEGSLINYYTISLYWCWRGDDTVPWRFLDKTEKIYSQKIEYTFYDDFVVRYKKRVRGEIVDVPANQATDMYYKAVIDIVTADGATISVSTDPIYCGGTNTDFPTAPIQELHIYNDDAADLYYPESINAPIGDLTYNYKHWIHVIGGSRQNVPDGTKFTYYRENLQTGEIKMLETTNDLTVPTKGKFRYYEVPRNSYGRAYLKGIVHRDIELDSDDMNGYTISELVSSDEIVGTKKKYYLGEQWKFVGDISDTTYTQNMDKYVHVGYNTYPSVTSTQTKYLSGSLSALMGYVNCETKKFVDDIDKIRAWRDFITRQSIYMLKSQKGEVLVVAVSNNPTISYEEMTKELSATFAFDWVEVEDINNIRVYVDHDFDPNHDY